MFGNDERMLDATDAVAEGNWSYALQLLKELVKLEVPDAEHFMGWFFEQGIEVEQSDSKAFYWWSKAAVNGVPESQNAIAFLYREGRGTDVDLEQAYYWYSMAYENGDSQSRLGKEELEKNFTDTQLKSLNEKIYADKILLNLK